MEKYHGKTVEYWKQNAEENYLTTPISVLKYIIVLEEQIEQLRKQAIVGRSEQLIDFAIKNGYIDDMPKGQKDGLIDKFEKSINCH